MIRQEIRHLAKDKSFQPDALTTMAKSELGNAYLRMLGECKAMPTVAVDQSQSKDSEQCKAGMTAAPVQPRSLNVSDEERKAGEKVWEKVCSIRRARLRFHSMRAGGNPAKFSVSEVYKPSGELTKVFKSTRAAKMEEQRNKEMRAFVFCADTFGFHEQRSAKPIVEWSDEMEHMLKWLAPHKDNNTIVMCFDGRSRTCRRKLDEWMCETFPEESKQAELWITYAGVTAAADPREPKRKVAFSDESRECVYVGLPVPKTGMKAKPRPCFTARGDNSTHSQVYSLVPKRSLRSLPRLQKAEKEAMIGDVEDLPKCLIAEAKNGHPLYWNEVKSVGLLSQLLSDLDVGHVVDLSPASGAVAAAAAMNHITYDGFCFNDMHMQWLDGVLDQMMLMVLAGNDVKNQDKGFAEDIKKYFAASIADAERLVSDIREQADVVGTDDEHDV